MRKHGAVLVETGEYLNISHPPLLNDITFLLFKYVNRAELARQQL